MTRYSIIAVVIVVSLVGLACTASSSQGSPTTPQPTATAVVEVTPTPVPEPTSVVTTPSEPSMMLVQALGKWNRLLETDKVSGDRLLNEPNPQFEIIQMISNRQLLIRILQPPFEEGRRAVTEWFLDPKQGFNQQDVCVLAAYGKIRIFASKDVKPDFTEADSFPTGCQAPPQ